MKLKLTLLISILFHFSSHAQVSNSNEVRNNNMNQNHNGYLDWYNEDGTIEKKYFYIYAYQYAYLVGNKIEHEQHEFETEGCLRDGGDLKIVMAIPNEPYIIYENELYALKIPFAPGNPIWFKSKNCSVEYIGDACWQKLE